MKLECVLLMPSLPLRITSASHYITGLECKDASGLPLLSRRIPIIDMTVAMSQQLRVRPTADADTSLSTNLSRTVAARENSAGPQQAAIITHSLKDDKSQDMPLLICNS